MDTSSRRQTPIATSQRLMGDLGAPDYLIIRQLEAIPISEKQLVAEVKGIYAAIQILEETCIEMDNKLATSTMDNTSSRSKLNNKQWQALVTLHRKLIHEHHEFFSASQHPSASPALRLVPSHYAMSVRMWRHGIHPFLELLRRYLPASFDHMLAFIYIAYRTVANLYETVPAFKNIWIECLGDLARYRMAIETNDAMCRNVWNETSRSWYLEASNMSPLTGRLYHHLAVLANPNILQQLYYYAKSLCVTKPFVVTSKSILTMFDPIIKTQDDQRNYRFSLFDTPFVKAHGYLFTNQHMEKFETTMIEFLAVLDCHIGRVTRRFLEQGYQISISNNAAVLGFCSDKNPIIKAIALSETENIDTHSESTADESLHFMYSLRHAERLSNSTLNIILQRIGDPNCLSYIHCTLVFMDHMSKVSDAMDLLAQTFPWQRLAIYLNTLLTSKINLDRIQAEGFPVPPVPEKVDVHPLPEDYAMRGLRFAEKLYSEEWFLDDNREEEVKYHELHLMEQQRKERILWLACRICYAGSWIRFDSSQPRFTVDGRTTDLGSLDSNLEYYRSLDHITPA